ncbi:hypothetical protein GCM10009733_024880 [Nonomuraea maheshkhaliensis]|uniref:Uncharacterized protein n=1 Tax=Nonomuraea maheshkhaliensis TaxID=419590 RepID=A0ABP4QZK8_9ACTN
MQARRRALQGRRGRAARVVDHDVEPVEPRDQPLDVRRIAHIGLDETEPPGRDDVQPAHTVLAGRVGAPPGRTGSAGLMVAAGGWGPGADGDLGAGRGEGGGDAGAYSLGATGHQDALARVVVSHGHECYRTKQALGKGGDGHHVAGRSGRRGGR